jgi:hypothetical protein
MPAAMSAVANQKAAARFRHVAGNVRENQCHGRNLRVSAVAPWISV